MCACVQARDIARDISLQDYIFIEICGGCGWLWLLLLLVRFRSIRPCKIYQSAGIQQYRTVALHLIGEAYEYSYSYSCL